MTERPSFAGKSPYLLLGLAILVLDQWSKWLVEEKLPMPSAVEVIPNLLNFVHVRNTGVAFGLFASHGDTTGTLILIGLGLLALSFVVYYFAITPLWDRLLLVSLGLVLGGAIGNLVDRIAQGGVTDFIDFYYGTYHWHTFNVADSAISVGIGLMLLGAFRQPPPDSEETTASEAASDDAAADGEPDPSDGAEPSPQPEA
ncbi:MAG: signal peptidase II [Acidobacteriota bacterium]